MIYLLLAVLFSVAIIVTFRLMGTLKLSELQSITFNYLFAVGYGLVFWHEPFSIKAYTDNAWFAYALLIGVAFIVTFFLLSRSASTAGVSITAVASRMSVVIPVVAGFIIFNDSINILKIAGILLAIFSFYLIFKREGRLQIKWKKFVLPFLLFLGIGTNDTLMKLVEVKYLSGDVTLFLTVVFFVALVIGLAILLSRLAAKKEKFSGKNLISGFFLGSFNFGSTYYFIRSMSMFESSVLFPVVNVGIVVLASIIGLGFFKEKLSRINWLGIGVAMIAIFMITAA